MLKIGFVILTWNSERVIKGCLDSIYNMQDIEAHVAVIDNGSSDNTVDIISCYIPDIAPGRVSSLKLIRHESNMGTTATRNEGLRYLAGYAPDRYCILDSDTIVNAEAFKIMNSELERHPEYGLIGPAMYSSDGVRQVSARAFPTFGGKLCKALPSKRLQGIGERMEKTGCAYEGGGIHRDSGKSKGADEDGAGGDAADTAGACRSFPADYLMSACWFMRPEVIDKAGYLDEEIFYAPEDAEYCIRVWKAGFTVAYCPEAGIMHEWQRLSRRKVFSRHNLEHVKGLLYMFRKHGYAFSTKKLKRSFPR